MPNGDEPVAKPEVVGREGLGTTIAAVAAQISAVEKQAMLQTDALRREMQGAIESLRRETVIEIQRFTMMIEGVRSQAANDVARIQEVKDLHWKEHEDTHAQEHKALELAMANMDKRLDGMNEFRAQMGDQNKTFATKDETNRAITNLEGRLFRLEEDTRRRFELGEATARDRFEKTGHETRTTLRPLEDMKVGQGAVIAAIIFGISLLGAIVLIANFVTAGP
jgi:hypothetical protein